MRPRLLAHLAAPMFLLIFFAGCQSVAPPQPKLMQDEVPAAERDWQHVLAERLPLYGHRNWIVIADSAYPAQSREGIETIVTNADYFTVLETVLNGLNQTQHVKPIVYEDAELKYVSPQDAPQVSTFRDRLANILGNRVVQVTPHEEVIAKLDKAGETFRILILKTNLTIPYTSVFLQLDCAYWNADSEKRVRDAMK